MNDDRAFDALSLAEAALAEAMLDGVTEAEALVMAEDSALTRFANSEIHQNVAETNSVVNLRVVIGKRIGVASTGRTDPEGLRRLAQNAAAIAGVVEELDDWGGLPGPSQATPIAAGYSAATAGASPEFRAEGARAVIAAADAAGVIAYGSFATSLESTAVANSNGVRVAGTRTTSQLITVSMGPGGGTGYAEAAAVDASTINPAAIGREAADKARATADAVSIEPGDYPVVLEEYSVVDLLDMLGYLGFSALAVQEERSFFEPGKRIGSDVVTIRDDGRDPAGLPLWFDFEGVAKQRVELVEHGVCRDVVHDSQTAARAGVTSTGHGLPAPNPYGPFPLNMVMEPGTATREELIGGLEQGLLVTRFHYTNPVHPKLAIVTGMTRDGTFLVE
ncbi:MAG: TldD/PmbA family protein, partial [Chloroflexota bacterium]